MKINGGFLICAAIILIFLKLIGEITWPWIWILCPLWLPLAITVGIFGIILCLMIGCGIIALIGFLIMLAIEARSE